MKRGLTLVIFLFVCCRISHAADDVVPTVIASDSGEMVSTDALSTFTFRKNVVVTGTNLKITCDELVVIANRIADPKATIGRQDRFKSLVATGHVRVVQNDREAVCERAEVFPGDDKVVLTGNPSVRSVDGQYRADGPRLVLYRGQRRAVIEGTATERASITLPPLKDLGYGKEQEAAPEAKPTPSPAPLFTPPPAPQK